MENMEPMSPADARAALDGAAAARDHLAEALRLPSYFHLSLGAAIALQTGTTAWALTGQARESVALTVLFAGLVVFFAVTVVQLLRFRRLNGAWVAGLTSKVVLGTSALASVAYAAGLALAIWAGFAGQWWLLVLAAIATGAAYAEAGRRWWRGYRAEPEQHARAESAVYLIALVLFAVAGLVLVALDGR